MKQLFTLMVAALLMVLLATTTATTSTQVDAAYSGRWAMDAMFASRVSNCEATLMSEWNCGSSCDYFPNMSDVKVFTNVSMDTRAWIGYDSAEDRVMLTIRGSRNIKNWVEDFEFWQIPYPGAPSGSDVKVEYGFYHVQVGLESLGMMTEFVALIRAHPGAAVLVNGHSLGASVATLAMVELLRTEKGNNQTNLMNRTVELYTFGSPRVGNPAFVEYAGSLLPHMRQHRLTHHHDPVPHLPPRALGYLHIPQEVYLPHNASTPFKLCNGTLTAEDPTCADAEKGNDAWDHIWYLGKCMGCCGPAPYDNCCKKLPLPKKHNDRNTKKKDSSTIRLPEGDFFVLP